jgi:hypothetical protein
VAGQSSGRPGFWHAIGSGRPGGLAGQAVWQDRGSGRTGVMADQGVGSPGGPSGHRLPQDSENFRPAGH